MIRQNSRSLVSWARLTFRRLRRRSNFSHGGEKLTSLAGQTNSLARETNRSHAERLRHMHEDFLQNHVYSRIQAGELIVSERSARAAGSLVHGTW